MSHLMIYLSLKLSFRDNSYLNNNHSNNQPLINAMKANMFYRTTIVVDGRRKHKLILFLILQQRIM